MLCMLCVLCAQTYAQRSCKRHRVYACLGLGDVCDCLPPLAHPALTHPALNLPFSLAHPALNLPSPPPPCPCQVTVPAELQAALKDNMQAAGIPLPHSEEAWQQALHALKVGGRVGGWVAGCECVGGWVEIGDDGLLVQRTYSPTHICVCATLLRPSIMLLDSLHSPLDPCPAVGVGQQVQRPRLRVHPQGVEGRIRPGVMQAAQGSWGALPISQAATCRPARLPSSRMLGRAHCATTPCCPVQIGVRLLMLLLSC